MFNFAEQPRSKTAFLHNTSAPSQVCLTQNFLTKFADMLKCGFKISKSCYKLVPFFCLQSDFNYLIIENKNSVRFMVFRIGL